MGYKALYRNYRPSTFEEVAGQQHIVKTLQNALKTNKIAHAYLFAGPRGTGKTSMAKLFAKALNCEHGLGCQCNECKNCIAINEGTHPDVLEIDAASNNGVDEIRDLIDKVKYGTILGRYKVYIIDEVHMMTPGAFNALLKTLEEPPEHVIFILATTEPHKILPTILSRCQRYDFTKVSDQDIKERIRYILHKEGIEFNDEAVDLLISLCDGGMRDALSILDQILAYSGGTLVVQDILDVYSLESKEEKKELLANIMQSNTGEVLKKVNKYISKGSDIKRLTNDLLVILKDILVYQTTYKFDYLETLKDEEVIEFSKYQDKDITLKMIDILMETVKDYKNVTSINPLFEVALLKLTSLNKTINTKKVEREEVEEKPFIDESLSNIEPIEKPMENIQKPVITEVKETKIEDNEPLFEDNITLLKDLVIPQDVEREDDFYIDDELMIKIMVISKKELKNDFLENWKNIKKISTHPMLGKVALSLIDSHPLVVNNKILIVECPLPKVAEKLNSKSNQQILQNIIYNVFNKKMFIYAVPRTESVRLQQRYMNLLQLSKLPKASDIHIDFLGE